MFDMTHAAIANVACHARPAAIATRPLGSRSTSAAVIAFDRIVASCLELEWTIAPKEPIEERKRRRAA
ncbi:hypothetical protein ACFSHT_24055 [Paraburkholderia silviterrae]|uniref:Uncharacterized protein n=1 Tax=Paraburkholderia silviterrae TaxID=2528715 RepID=A0A4R5MBU7_9BURK|nr:hypothetical protein [Paraburkholderia silviterrae]TDG24035.1 hypothetical protein EYW47_11010 [Paraburkholderia silviterrae]